MKIEWSEAIRLMDDRQLAILTLTSLHNNVSPRSYRTGGAFSICNSYSSDYREAGSWKTPIRRASMYARSIGYHSLRSWSLDERRCPVRRTVSDLRGADHPQGSHEEEPHLADRSSGHAPRIRQHIQNVHPELSPRELTLMLDEAEKKFPGVETEVKWG